MVAIYLFSSTKSRLVERSCLFLLLSNWSVLIIGNPISNGTTASELYVIEKGVSLVDLLSVVRYAYKTWGN